MPREDGAINSASKNITAKDKRDARLTVVANWRYSRLPVCTTVVIMVTPVLLKHIVD
jgi:hypothetical protein